MPGQHKICVHVGFHGIREHRCNECRCKCPTCRELNKEVKKLCKCGKRLTLCPKCEGGGGSLCEHGRQTYRCVECKIGAGGPPPNAASATGREPAGSAILKSTAPVDPGSSSSKVPRTIFVCDSPCAQALADVGAAPYNRGASYSGDDAKDGCAAEARRVCQKRNRGVPMHAGEPRSSSPPGIARSSVPVDPGRSRGAPG